MNYNTESDDETLNAILNEKKKMDKKRNSSSSSTSTNNSTNKKFKPLEINTHKKISNFNTLKYFDSAKKNVDTSASSSTSKSGCTYVEKQDIEELIDVNWMDDNTQSLMSDLNNKFKLKITTKDAFDEARSYREPIVKDDNFQLLNDCVKTSSFNWQIECEKHELDELNGENWMEDTPTFMNNINNVPKKLEINPTQNPQTYQVRFDNNNNSSFNEKTFTKPNLLTNNINNCFNNEISQKVSEELFSTLECPIKISSSTTQSNENQSSNEEKNKIQSQLSQLQNIQEIKKLNNNVNVKKDEDLWEKNGMTQLLTNGDVHVQINVLFDKFETEICKPNNKEDVNFSQKNLIMNDNFISSITKAINANNSENDTITNVLNLNDKNLLCKIIKQALVENVGKTSEPSNFINSTIKETQQENKVLGDFFNLPNAVKDLLKSYKGIDKLYDWQIECLSLPAIEARKNLIYALPTSGGKTLVAEILMLREVLCRNKNVIFVLPYVSIVQEKIWALSPFAVAFDFLIEEYAAGKGSYPPRKRRRKNSIYIATIEKALGLVNSLIETNRIKELGLVVVDELHLVGEQSRGSTLEALLTKLIYIKEKNIQVIGMSATIGNLPEIQTFLKASLYEKNFRPVELIEYVKCENLIFKINWQAEEDSEFFEHIKTVNYKYSECVLKIDPDYLGGLVMEVIPNASCLIFCPSRKNCENVAILLCKVLDPRLKQIKRTEKSDLIKVLIRENQNICHILSNSIPFGVAYHHSGLTTEERKVIEDGFRNGIISVICCTSTLAAGVNLPAKRVILRQPFIGRDFINLSRYKQMVGRAGRAGFEESGESVVICKPKELGTFRQMLKNPMDNAQSRMQDEDCKGLRQLILSSIHLELATNRLELHNIISKTLLAVQETSLNVNVKKVTDYVIVDLFKLGALESPDSNSSLVQSGSSVSSVSVRISSTFAAEYDEDEQENVGKKRISITNSTLLKISPLGSAAIKAGLDLNRAHLLYQDLYQAANSLVLIDNLHLLYLVTPYDVSTQIKIDRIHYYQIFSQLNENELKTARVLGLTESCAIKLLRNQPLKRVSELVLTRFYGTLMLSNLWNEISIYDVSEKFQVNRGIIQNLMIGAASFASNVVNFCEEFEQFWPFVHLIKGMIERLSHCCAKEIIPLMELPSVKQSRARQLYNAGYKTLQSIAKANVDDLIDKIEFMTRKVANQLISAAKMILLEKVENLREEAVDVLEGIDQQQKSIYSQYN